MFYFRAIDANKLVKKTIAKQYNLSLLFRKLQVHSFSVCRHKNYSLLKSESHLASAPMDVDAQLLKTAKSELLQIFDASVASVLPSNLVKSKVKLADDQLIVNDSQYSLPENVNLVGFGKAVEGMAYSMEEILGARLKRSILSVPKSSSPSDEPVDDQSFPKLYEHKQSQTQQMKSSKSRVCMGAEYNQPDEASFKSTACIVELAKKLGEEDLLIVLMSGGGSALLFKPREPLTPESKRELCKRLQNAGASITELNRVRIFLSEVKGGGLAKVAYPAKVLTLVLSDVVGDPLDIIASGPTYFVDEEQIRVEAIDILKKYNIFDSLTKEVKQLFTEPRPNALESKAMTEEKKFKHVDNVVIGNNETALKAAATAAIMFNLKSVILTSTVQGDVKDVSLAYANLLTSVCFALENKFLKTEDFVNSVIGKTIEILNISKEKLDDVFENLKGLNKDGGLLLLAGGEPTVTVTGVGKGGRNQELALRFSLDWLAEISKQPLLAKYFVLYLSAGTDGQDGPTDVTGAFGRPAIRPKISQIQQDLMKQLRATVIPDKQEDLKRKIKAIEEMLPENTLKNNDSYNFYSNFENGENLVKTGMTGTNVMDLHFIYIKRRSCECDINAILKDANNSIKCD